MKKALKWIAIVVGSLAVILFIAGRVIKYNTKKASPEETVTYNQDGLKIDVYYNRPSKKGREIFGSLVPYGKVWRTGANEASTFENSQAVTIGGKQLPAGKYTLFTVPDKDHWTVIFNKKSYGWGINWDQSSPREEAEDALTVDVPVQALPETVEMFTISFGSGPTLDMAWDKTKVSVPIAK